MREANPNFGRVAVAPPLHAARENRLGPYLERNRIIGRPGPNSLGEKRLLHIDGLRGVAVLLVLVTHTWVFTGAPALSFELGGMTIALAALPAVGHVGVNLFLVLSGFCLAWPFMLDASYRRRMTALAFWTRRIKRIAPAYYISMAIVFAMYPAFGLVLREMPADRLTAHASSLAIVPPIREVWSHLAFLHNLWPEHASSINGSYWSMALEFQLYFLFPLFVELLFRWGPWRTLVAVLLIQTAYRTQLWVFLDAKTLEQFDFVLPKAVFGRMLDFYCGILAARLAARGRTGGGVAGSALVPYGGAALLGAAFWANCRLGSFHPLVDPLWSFGFAAIVWHSCRAATWCRRALCFGPLAALGVASYSVYLLHQPLIERIGFVIRLSLRPGWAFVAGLLCLPLVVGLALLFYVTVERPFLHLFARRPRREAGVGPTAVVPREQRERGLVAAAGS